MRVQGQHHGRSFLHDTYAGMTSAVNARLMPFRQTKLSLQIQVVARQIGSTTTREWPRLETRHEAPHLLTDRILVCQQFAPNCVVVPFALRPTTGSRVQGDVDLTNCLDIRCHLFVRFHHQVPPFVDAADQPLEQRLCFPPFFCRTLRRNDCFTSSSASAIRIPGGRKGPPWLSLMMPRTTAQ